MGSPPPRLAPTLVLAALWLALYLLWLGVRPQPAVEDPPRATTTSTARRDSASPAGGLSSPVSRPAPTPRR